MGWGGERGRERGLRGELEREGEREARRREREGETGGREQTHTERRDGGGGGGGGITFYFSINYQINQPKTASRDLCTEHKTAPLFFPVCLVARP